MRFYLNFKSDSYGKKRIDEPFGVDGIKFSLKQKTEGGAMARDISFSGGEIQFEFTDMREHEIKQLLYYHRKFGFEAVVVLTLELDENNSYNCDLDFATAETDDLTYFKCKGIEDSKLQIIKARKKVKVDLFSNKDADGNFINPLNPKKLLVFAKPVFQTSKWEQTTDYDENLDAVGEGTGSRVYYQLNPTNLVTYGLEDSYQFFQPTTEQLAVYSKSDYLALKAKDNLRKISISIKNIDLSLETDVDNGGNGFVDFSLVVAKGNDFATAEKTKLLNSYLTENQVFNFKGDKFLQIESLKRDESIWIYFEAQVRQSANAPIGTPRFECFTKIKGMKMEVTAESTSYNSVSKSFKLLDVIKQVVKSISGLDVNAPFLLNDSNMLVNGDLLRGIDKKGFKISLEDIENSLPEFKADFEIGSDGKVFFGLEREFYTSIQSGFFDNTQFDKMNKTFNPKYSVNEFNYKYKNYQSLKENEELNSADTIHGESRFVFFNKLVENKKDVNIEWTRDPFLIEATRKKAIQITEQTASQDDDNIFIIDTLQVDYNTTFTEVTNLQHTYNAIGSRLILRNDGSVNFNLLGIVPNSIFTILTPDANAGNYTVFSVLDNVLELTRILGVVTPLGDGLRQTNYSYTIEASEVPFITYTNQGFSETENLNASEKYANRRYSTARNIYNFWNSYLATCNMYWKNNPIRNTWYKNNGDYTAKYDGIKLTEKDDFIPQNPILTPVLYNNIVFKDVDFVDFIQLQNNIRSQRGFIRTIDNNEKVIKIYPVDMEYSLLEKELKIKGEEKFEPISMTISTEFNYVLINNETRVLSLDYEIVNEKLYLYDENRFRLYNPVFWMEVSVNSAIPNSIDQLKEWLDLI
jgi:hypothetical protein